MCLGKVGVEKCVLLADGSAGVIDTLAAYTLDVNDNLLADLELDAPLTVKAGLYVSGSITVTFPLKLVGQNYLIQAASMFSCVSINAS